ncbi:(2Fe-2S)-binding protein [Pseudomonas taeanensis MS-3]|jgi:predicted molibdopterin-dependent oxidoreductase YjgC|uniref:(2Fe-2S)-binding protein n=1 Tax=Pseudomonas taeanensis MS-3 TaxID=1395571 RepID=A0A0A1YLP2_9PSED|nr:(2Fe-2S)-binding protein [Pseudomonas taeanensis]KFX69589.1 (2Fe-2S)-binding protein [Pseudomonas taeanensis MS-3]
MIELILDGLALRVAAGSTVAAALYLGGDGSSRTSVGDQRRAPVCGMGICQECRVSIDGQRRLACQTLCQPGMCVETHA